MRLTLAVAASLASKKGRLTVASSIVCVAWSLKGTLASSNSMMESWMASGSCDYASDSLLTLGGSYGFDDLFLMLESLGIVNLRLST